ALLAVPLFSSRDPSFFHADPHAGNLLYDVANRELIVLDWALAESLDLECRRRLVMLAVMMALQNAEGVREAIHGLRRPGGKRRADERSIEPGGEQFFAGPAPGSA